MQGLLRALGMGDDVIEGALRAPVKPYGFVPRDQRRGQNSRAAEDFLLDQELKQILINGRRQARARVGRESLTSARTPYRTRGNPLLKLLAATLLGSGIGGLGYLGYRGFTNLRRNDERRELERLREEEEADKPELLPDPYED